MKRITKLQVSSVTLALLTLAEWTYLGISTPVIKAMHADFRADPADFDWPYPYVMSFHWVWCIPVGVLLAAVLTSKDRWCSCRVAVIANLAVFFVGIALAVSWMWGTVPHRMTQRAEKLWQNQAASPNRRPRFAFAALPRFGYSFCARPASSAAVGEPRRSMSKIYLTLENSSKNPLMVQIEPEGADFWLLPKQEFELQADSDADQGHFEVQHCDGYIAVYPSRDVGYISVFQNGVEVECGHQRPANCP